jgi:hypothetical protein
MGAQGGDSLTTYSLDLAQIPSETREPIDIASTWRDHRHSVGLPVKARILDKVYGVGRKCSDSFRDIKDNFIPHDDVLGHCNYTPRCARI